MRRVYPDRQQQPPPQPPQQQNEHPASRGLTADMSAASSSKRASGALPGNADFVAVATAVVVGNAALAGARALTLARLDVPGEAWGYVVATLAALVVAIIVAVRVRAEEAAAPPPHAYQSLRNASIFTKMMALAAAAMSIAVIIAAAGGALWRDALTVVAALGVPVLGWYLGSVLPYPPQPRRKPE